MSFPSKNELSVIALQKRLLEVAVVVGVDEETGLHRRNLENGVASEENNVLFQWHFQAHLLDIISGTQEYSNDVLMQPDASMNQKSWMPSLKSIKNPRIKQQNVSKNVQKRRSVRKLRKLANKDEAVSVSTDFLSNLPYICLPDDSRVYKEDQPPHTHFAVLTDVNGTRHYAAILKIYQALQAVQENKNGSLTWKLTKNSSMGSSQQSNTKEAVSCFAPLCICFITSTPYFDVLKTALSCLYQHWQDALSYELFRRTLQKYVTNLSVISCPPPNIRLSFSLGGWPFTMSPSSEVSQPHLVNDMDLSIPLFIFMERRDILLQVLACIMLEQRIVFVSENYSLITLVIEALLTYISPFVWPHQYVPLLFSEIIDFVACPGIFLMGCHAMHKEQIKQVENDQILVDLDNGVAFACASFEWVNDTGQAAVKTLDQKLDCHFPSGLEEKVLKRLAKLSLFDGSKLARPSPVSVKDVHQQQAHAKEIMNKKIKTIFMEMMVDLFGDSSYFLDHEINQFRDEEFLDTVRASDLPFYIKVLKSYMFKRFVKDRLRRTPDTFNEMAKARRKRPGNILARRAIGKVRSTGDMAFSTQSLAPDHQFNSRASLKLSKTRSSKTVWYSDCNSTEWHSEIVNSIYFFVVFAWNANMKFIFLLFECVPLLNNDSSVARSKAMRKDNLEVLSINLPSFPIPGTNFNAAHFYQRCVDVINAAMQKIPTSENDSFNASMKQHSHTTRASCLLMRGFYCVATGNLLQGLEDLHETAKHDVRLFPIDVIKSIMASLSPTELQRIRKQSFYKGDDYYSALERARSSESFYFGDEDLPCSPLDSKTFTMLLEKSGVTSISDVIRWLFDALSNKATSSDEHCVDHEAFAAFYSTWKECKHECETSLRDVLSAADVNVDLVGNSERLLKVSSVVSSSKGSGRLILTTEKILFMNELYEECKFTPRLTQLEEVKLTKIKTFFKSSAALGLKHDGDMIRVALKEDSELWKYLIEEMKTGRMLSNGRSCIKAAKMQRSLVRCINVSRFLLGLRKEHMQRRGISNVTTLWYRADWKDHQMTTDKAAQNVRVADALYQAARDEGIVSMSNINTWVKKLCHFTELHHSGQLSSLPEETEEMLVLRIDVTPKEAKKSEVNDIFYSSAGTDPPCVWIALSSSKIRLIDTTQWSLDSRPINDCQSNLTCMCSVGKELWVGASDNTICIIGCDSLKKTKVLHDHSSTVMAVFYCGEQIVSAASCGEVILWNKEAKTKKSRFTIPGPHNMLVSASSVLGSVICCCTKSSVLLYSLKGERNQLLTLKDFFSSPSVASDITCCLCSGDEIWAGDSRGSLYIWFRKSSANGTRMPPLGDRHNRFVPKCTGILFDPDKGVSLTCIMIAQDRKVWVGNSVGEITILHGDTLCQERTLKAHCDYVTSLCHVEHRYVLSGSRSNDGKIAVWRSESVAT